MIARRSLLIDLHESLQANKSFASSQVSQYGSFPAGLSTFMSDVDVSVNIGSGINGGDIDTRTVESFYPNNKRKRPTSSEDDSCCDLKRTKADENNSDALDMAALRQRIADKLAAKFAAKECSAEVIVDDDAPVSWAIETTRSSSCLDVQNDSPVDSSTSDDHEEDNIEDGTSFRQSSLTFAPAVRRRKDTIRVLQKLHHTLQVPISLYSLIFASIY